MNFHTRYAFSGQPFWVKLYLAQEEGIQSPLTDLIAEGYNFSQKPELDGKVVCGNCKKGQKVRIKSTAYIPITPILYKHTPDRSEVEVSHARRGPRLSVQTGLLESCQGESLTCPARSAHRLKNT